MKILSSRYLLKDSNSYSELSLVFTPLHLLESVDTLNWYMNIRALFSTANGNWEEVQNWSIAYHLIILEK